MISHKLRKSLYGAYNPSFNNVTMLLHGDGTNAAQNNTFIDSSANNFTFTRIGAPMQGSVNPFATNIPYSPSNGAGGFFDGSSALTVPDNVAFTMGAGNFTIECWAYATVTAGTTYILGQTDASFTTASTSFGFQINAGLLTTFVLVGSTYHAVASTLPANQWVHIAFVRQGTTLRLYLNGVQTSSSTTISTSSVNDSSQIVAVGRAGASAAGYFTGYLSDIRIIKGTALYLNGTTFAVPTTPSTAVSGTSLLCNFKNAGIYDSSAKTEVITQGNAQLSTAVLKYGTASMAFDGTGDYLSSVFNASFDLLPNSFTIEAWVYPTSSKSGGQRFFATGGGFVGWNATTGIHVLCQIGGTTNYLSMQVSNNTASPVGLGTSMAVPVNVWSYIAFVYDSAAGKLRIFKDGVMVEGSVTGVARPSTNPVLNVASIPGENGAATIAYQGYIADLQVTKGVAKYNMSFTPPTKPYPNS
jgi:hypothetical protein